MGRNISNDCTDLNCGCSMYDKNWPIKYKVVYMFDVIIETLEDILSSIWYSLPIHISMQPKWMIKFFNFFRSEKNLVAKWTRLAECKKKYTALRLKLRSEYLDKNFDHEASKHFYPEFAELMELGIEIRELNHILK